MYVILPQQEKTGREYENLVSNIFLCQNLHTTPSEIPFMET